MAIEQQLRYVWQVAEMLALSESHVRSLIKQNELTVVKIGIRGRRVTVKSIEDFLKRNRVDQDE